MTTTIEAIYEGGIFRPTQHISLTEGTHVEVIVPQPALARDPKAVADRLAQIAAKAPPSNQIESTSRDHDQILYDTPKQP